MTLQVVIKNVDVYLYKNIKRSTKQISQYKKNCIAYMKRPAGVYTDRNEQQDALKFSLQNFG